MGSTSSPTCASAAKPGGVTEPRLEYHGPTMWPTSPPMPAVDRQQSRSRRKGLVWCPRAAANSLREQMFKHPQPDVTQVMVAGMQVSSIRALTLVVPSNLPDCTAPDIASDVAA